MVIETKKLYLTAGILMSFTAFSGLTLTSTPTSATNTNTSTDDVAITIPVACTLNASGNTSHSTSIVNGTYEDEIGTTTLNVTCNDGQGFAIYAVGYTGNEIGATNSTKLVGTNASSNTTIDTGTATTAGNPDVSNWAMKLNTTTSPTPTYPVTIDNSYNSYSIVPASYTKVAHRDSGTDVGTNAVGSTLTTTYAAYISKTQAPDTYTGQVKYTLVHPSSEEPLQPQTATSGCINYFPNGSGVVGTMGCQSISSSDTTAQLLASNFSRANYGFAGWSDSYDYATNPNAKFYGPQETITFTAGQYTSPNNGLSLYAVWVPSAGTIQNWNGCSSLTQAPTNGTANLSSVTALTDERDNNTYAIAKLADGKCWMIENLRLESTAAHNSDGTLAQGYGTSTTYGNFSGLADAENTGFSTTYTANSLYYSGTQEGTASIDIGTSNYPGYRMPRYNNYNNQATSANRPQNPTSDSATNSTTNAGMYSYGNYYTWHAAIADLTYNDTNNQSTTGTSLCPAGWRLPQGGRKANVSVSDFWILSRAAIGTDPANFADDYFYYTGTPEGANASNIMKSYPNNFLYSGYFNTSSANNRGSYGYYWSSTARDYEYSYYLYLGNSGVYPGTNHNYKRIGYSIRCVVGS